MSDPFRYDVTNGYSCYIAIKCDCSLINYAEPISEPENQHLPRFDVFSSIFRVCFRVRYVIRRGERIENGEEDVLDTVPEPLSNVPGE